MRTVIRLDPKDANALNYLGYTYADLGKNLDEAERLVQEALKHKPEDGYIIDSLGWVYYKKGNYEKALEILEKAVSLVPDDPTILEHLGDAYIKLNDKKKALDIYKKSLLNAQNGKEGLRKKIREICEEGN
jgi:tetratricopeptide (TPR) repeat protein